MDTEEKQLVIAAIVTTLINGAIISIVELNGTNVRPYGYWWLLYCGLMLLSALFWPSLVVGICAISKTRRNRKYLLTAFAITAAVVFGLSLLRLLLHLSSS